MIRTLPAIHLDQSVSFILDWNGLRFAFSSGTLPNQGWRERATDADLSTHECFIPPPLMMARYGMAPSAIRSRMGVPNHDAFPAPVQRVKQPPDSMNAYQWTEFSLSGVEPESARVTNALIEAFNQRNGTDIKPGITGLPFRKQP